MKAYYEDATVTVHAGDCLDVLRELPDASVDSVVTDPPYGLEFMGKDWDAPWKQGADVHAEARLLRGDEMVDENKRRFIASAVNKYAAGLPFQQWCQLWATECLRVLKPGGHLLAFGGTRTSHRLACAVEDAGFEIRDSIAWLYGSGFPKSLDVSKAIDKLDAVEERDERALRFTSWMQTTGITDNPQNRHVTAAHTPDAERWQGWGTALKPAHEPIVVARKPLAGTVAANVLAHGTGALNVDGCRIEHASDADRGGKGRWPANVVLDESQAAALDAMSGERKGSGVYDLEGNRDDTGRDRSTNFSSPGVPSTMYADSGGASRFFYTAKADAGERVRIDGVSHPTVKPLSLMRWLVRLVTPPGGTVLEPFAGSGTTVEACILEGFQCIAIEREADYLPLIVQRIQRRRDPVAAVKASGEDEGLFEMFEEGA